MKHLESYVPLRNMRDNRNKTSQQTSYWPLQSEAEIPEERISKDDTGTESTEMWNAIKNVKDYVLSSGYQVIDRITAMCKTPRSMDEISERAPQQSNNPTQSPIRRFKAAWPNSLVDSEKRGSWIKNMLSDPDVSGDTKLNIWRIVENDYKVQPGSVPLVGNWQRMLPLKPMPHTSRYSPYGSRQISPRRSLYEATRLNSFPPLQSARGRSSTFTERIAGTTYQREISPYHAKAPRKSRGSTRRGFANIQDLRSPTSVPDTKRKPRSRPTREFGLSPTENHSRFVNYSDPAISQALVKYRRGGITYTKEDFDNYTKVKKSQFVGSRSRPQLSEIKKPKEQKRKAYQSRCEPSEISRIKRSRCEDTKEEIGAGVHADISSLNTRFKPDVCSTATILTQSPITKDESMHFDKSSKDDDLNSSESQTSTDAVAPTSLFAAPTSSVVANLFGTMPNSVGGSSGQTKGERFEPSSNFNFFNKQNSSSESSPDKTTAKAVAPQLSEPKLSKVKQDRISMPDFFDRSVNSKPTTSKSVSQSPSKAEKKIVETKAIEKRSAEKVPGGKLKVSDEIAPAEITPCENVSFVSRMAQMRRIKIKEHYSQEIEKLYDRHCKDKDKDAKKKKAMDAYENKYHKTRQDHMFYSKLCRKYNVEPAEEYDGNDPDIKPDDEEKEEGSEPMQSSERRAAPLLYGIPSTTNVKSADNINPFANDLFTAKETDKDGGLDFMGKNGESLKTKSSDRRGLFLGESDKCLAQPKADSRSCSEVISSSPSTGLLEKPIRKDIELAPFSFTFVKPTKEDSKESKIAENRAEARKTTANAINILKDGEKKSPWKHHFEGTTPNFQVEETQKKDEKTTSSRNLKTIFGVKAPAGNMFGGDSNNVFTMPKPTSTPSFNLVFNSEKTAAGGLFVKNNGGSSSAKTRGLFSGTNIFDVKSDHTPKPLANCGSGSTSSPNIFASSKPLQAPVSLLSPASQSTATTLFSNSVKGMFTTNNSGFNINNKNETSEPKLSFGNVNGNLKPSGKKRKIVRGRRTIK